MKFLCLGLQCQCQGKVVDCFFIFTSCKMQLTKPGKNGEIQLTDAMASLLKDRDMYGLRFDGTRYDIGNKLDFLKTNVVFGLDREDLGADFKEFIIKTAARIQSEE